MGRRAAGRGAHLELYVDLAKFTPQCYVSGIGVFLELGLGGVDLFSATARGRRADVEVGSMSKKRELGDRGGVTASNVFPRGKEEMAGCGTLVCLGGDQIVLCDGAGARCGCGSWEHVKARKRVLGDRGGV